MTKRVPSLLAAGLLGAVLLLCVAPGRATASAGCHPDADELRVTFQPVDHSLAPASWFRARLTLQNTDRRCALDSGWRLFFNSVRQPLAVYPPGALGDRRGAARSGRPEADDRLRGRQAPDRDGRHALRPEHRAADGARAGRPH